jgi:hypothetical protein
MRGEELEKNTEANLLGLRIFCRGNGVVVEGK